MEDRIVHVIRGRSFELRRDATACQRDRLAEERAKVLLTAERLRYRAYQRAGTLSRFMQRVGDWGREWFPVIRFRY